MVNSVATMEYIHVEWNFDVCTKLPVLIMCIQYNNLAFLPSAIAPLQMSETLSDVSVEVNATASFTCRASGLPAPRFRWLLKGTEHTGGVTSTNDTRSLTVDVESTLVLPAVAETDTGTVTCVAYHERNGQVVVEASTANLIVLSECISFA